VVRVVCETYTRRVTLNSMQIINIGKDNSMCMNKKMRVFGILIILPTIFRAMETPVAIADEHAVVVAWCKNYENKDYEDRYFYEYIPEIGHVCGLADGHCGSKTSDFIAKNMGSLIAEQKGSDVSINISQAVHVIDKKVKDFRDGSTLVCANIIKSKDCEQHDSIICHLANVGDSRAVLGRIASQGKYVVSFCTQDHKPKGEELRRILLTGGFVSETGYVRADLSLGGLAMTRSIGDYNKDPKKRVIIATPECTTHDISDVTEDDFLVFGTDGLWDYLGFGDHLLSENEFSQHAFSRLSEGVAQDISLIEIAKKLVIDALEKCSEDDITCMIVKIKALMENKKAIMHVEEIVPRVPLFSSLSINDN